MTKDLAVVGIGNAIVDILGKCDDQFLNDNAIEKGIMQLIDAPRAKALYAAMPAGKEVSGGSVANTIAGLASLGISTGFVGKVKDDQLGQIFAHDIRAQGTVFETPMMQGDHGDETARSMILVTPDGERSMNTYLGVANLLNCDDVDPDLMARARYIYLEGYLFDRPDAQRAFVHAMQLCKAAGGKAALSLSDPFCVQRHHAAFGDLIANHVDSLFCNHDEVCAMFETDNPRDAVQKALQHVELVVCTLGSAGVLVGTSDGVIDCPAEPVKVIDKTGAGDLFAAGFLAGLVLDKPLALCAKMGGVAAGAVISQMGARPDTDIKALFHEHGLL